MTLHLETLKILVDRKGVVEIRGIAHGENEARRLAGELSLPHFHAVNFLNTAIRTDPLPPEVVQAIEARARSAGYHLEEVGDLEVIHAREAIPVVPGGEDDPSLTSTVAALHQHQLTPTSRQKLLLPLAVVGVVAFLAAVGGVIRDHATRSYSRKPSLADVVALAARPPAAQNVIAGLVDPDDSRYAEISVVSWPYWSGKAAVIDGYYVRIPGLVEPSIEALVKGEKGAAELVFQFDTSRRDGNRIHLDGIARGGILTRDVNLEAEIIPIATAGEAPSIRTDPGTAGYFDGTAIHYDRDATFSGVGKVAVKGFVLKTPEGWCVAGDNQRMALTGPFSPGLAAILEDLAVTESDLAGLASGKVSTDRRIELNARRATWYLNLAEVYPWTEGGRPGRRQLTREVGGATVDGVLLRRVYVRGTAA